MTSRVRGRNPAPAGSGPPSDTLQVHALQAWDLEVSSIAVFSDSLQVHASQC